MLKALPESAGFHPYTAGHLPEPPEARLLPCVVVVHLPGRLCRSCRLPWHLVLGPVSPLTATRAHWACMLGNLPHLAPRTPWKWSHQYPARGTVSAVLSIPKLGRQSVSCTTPPFQALRFSVLWNPDSIRSHHPDTAWNKKILLQCCWPSTSTLSHLFITKILRGKVINLIFIGKKWIL